MAALCLSPAASRLLPCHQRLFFATTQPHSTRLRLQLRPHCSLSDRTAIVWFKNDLRLHDHPGLLASTDYDLLLPLYIFDPHMLRWCSSNYLQALVEAVKDLRRALQSLGSDLIIRTGSIRRELSSLAQQVHASDVITEQEIEHEWHQLLSSVSANVHEGLGWGEVKRLQFWIAPLYQIERKLLPSSYREFQRMRCAVNSPLHAPASLPALPKNLDSGNVPQMSAIKGDIKQVLSDNIWHKSFKKLQNQGAESILKIEDSERNSDPLPARREETGVAEDVLAWREMCIVASPSEVLECRRKEPVVLLDEKDEIDGHRAGAPSAMTALDDYLRVYEEIFDVGGRETRERVLVRKRLGQAIALGRISRRTVYHRALEFAKAHNGGWSPSFGFSTFTAGATIQEIRSIEWYRMLATMSENDGRKNSWPVRTWCWRSFLIQYSVMGSRGPPIVLVHGFGAFWEHYRDNIKGLSGKGSRVWALTLLGFGRSEKPNVAYTELLWAELIRDFIVEVVGEPATLVGNSIGGYMVSMVAGLWPRIVSNLILLNAAGAVVPDRLPLRYLKPRGKSGVTRAAAQLILLYMRGVGRRLLKKCYPVNPWRADDWLVGEVMRASFDPGAAIVVESLMCWRKPRSITWFIDRYKDKVCVIQGFKDPLSRPTQRAQFLKAHCNNVTIKLLDAGHCPHDELPEEVNKLIMDWIQKSALLQSNMDHSSHVRKEEVAINVDLGSPTHHLIGMEET